MKTPKEIEQLANDYWEGCDGCDANDKYFFIKGFSSAYRQLQEDMDKKYTEEDLIKAKISVYDRYTEWNEEVASDARLCIERLNESLNKQD